MVISKHASSHNCGIADIDSGPLVVLAKKKKKKTPWETQHRDNMKISGLKRLY